MENEYKKKLLILDWLIFKNFYTLPKFRQRVAFITHVILPDRNKLICSGIPMPCRLHGSKKKCTPFQRCTCILLLVRVSEDCYCFIIFSLVMVLPFCSSKK